MLGDIERTSHNFASLSLKDVLEARDQYHFHLMNKQHVIGTAVGLYLIRKTDPWPTKDQPNEGLPSEKHRPASKSERTFENSEVRPYSWPCVLVLVDNWIDSFGNDEGQPYPEEMVPRALYLPDGRVIPVCVVKVAPAAPSPGAIPKWQWPGAWIGPGYPVIVDHQEQEHIASIGCLVSDGHTTYALTNRHVCGKAGERVYSLLDGRREPIGRASAKQATRIEFSKVYPDFPGRRTYLNLDIGLIEIDDLTRWTSQVYGLGPVGRLADLHEANMGLDLISAKVVAHGAASGPLAGEIKGLFYRYKSMGGYDYVADFLIAPDAGIETQMGDSGTVWHLLPRAGDKAAQLMPLAVEWGAQAFTADGSPSKQFHFAVATSLSNVCKLLDVDLVRQNNTDVHPYWGEKGHYSITAFACDTIKHPKLKMLMQANLDRLSFAKDSLDPTIIREAIKDAKLQQGFIPLADVSDLKWKTLHTKLNKGGRDDQVIGNGRTTGPEHPAHYADIDEPDADGKTLRDLCMADPSNADVEFWKAHYTSLGHTQPSSRGLLPFRVQQFFEEMVNAVKAGDMDRFVCAAGIGSHYVADACQPLHGSMYADGYKDRPTVIEHHHRDGSPYETQSNLGAGVHSTFETYMIDRNSDGIMDGIPKHQGKVALDPVSCGHDAAMETIKLMARTAKRIPPTDLVDAFIRAGAKKTVAVQAALWEQFGEATIMVMADGADVLAHLWDAAWELGDGERLTDLDPRDPTELQKLYENPEFVPSLDLDHIASALVQ